MTIKASSRAAHTNSWCNHSSPRTSTQRWSKGLRSMCFSTLLAKHTLRLFWKVSESYFKTCHNYQLHRCWPVTATVQNQQGKETQAHRWSLSELLHEAMQTLMINCHCGVSCTGANPFHYQLDWDHLPHDTGQTAMRQWLLSTTCNGSRAPSQPAV